MTEFLFDTLAQSASEVLVNGIINRGDQVLHYPEARRIHLRPWDELRHAADRTVPVYWGTDHPSRDPNALEIGVCELFIPRNRRMIMGRFRLSKKAMPGKLIGRLLDRKPVKLSPGLTVEALDPEFGAIGNEVYTHYERGHKYDHILLAPDSVATRCEPPVCGVHLHDTGGTSPLRHQGHGETDITGRAEVKGLEMKPDESTTKIEDGPGPHLPAQADQAAPQGELRAPGEHRARELRRPAEAPAKGSAKEQAGAPEASEATGGDAGPAPGRVQLDDTRLALIDRIVERHPTLKPEWLHSASGKLLLFLLDTGEHETRRSSGLPRPAGSATKQVREGPKVGDVHFTPYSQRGGKR